MSEPPSGDWWPEGDDSDWPEGAWLGIVVLAVIVGFFAVAAWAAWSAIAGALR